MAAGSYAALMEIEDIDEFCALLIQLVIDPREKKYILIQWCEIHGVALTRDLVERVGAA